VALIQNASLPNQRHTTTTLIHLHTTLVQEEFASPCVIVVGDVLLGQMEMVKQAQAQSALLAAAQVA
jgi:uroporphyrin-III C-methyltransferase